MPQLHLPFRDRFASLFPELQCDEEKLQVNKFPPDHPLLNGEIHYSVSAVFRTSNSLIRPSIYAQAFSFSPECRHFTRIILLCLDKRKLELHTIIPKRIVIIIEKESAWCSCWMNLPVDDTANNRKSIRFFNAFWENACYASLRDVETKISKSCGELGILARNISNSAISLELRYEVPVEFLGKFQSMVSWIKARNKASLENIETFLSRFQEKDKPDETPAENPVSGYREIEFEIQEACEKFTTSIKEDFDFYSTVSIN